MAGGIDWFRWHHGSVTDPKFALVAKKAGVSLPDVLAVWAFVLEKASAAEDRGWFGDLDAEAVDCLFGFIDGKTASILLNMAARGLIEGGAVIAWEKRQPKRERENDSSAERTRAYRERQKQPGDATQDHVTPCDATERHETPRGEESREEEKNSPSLRSGETRARRAPVVTVPVSELVDAGMDAKTAADFIAHKSNLKAPLTQRAWADHRSEALKAGWSVQAAAEKVMARSWKGFEAKYVEREARAPPQESFREKDARLAAERVAEMTGGILSTRPAKQPLQEIFDVTPRALG